MCPNIATLRCRPSLYHEARGYVLSLGIQRELTMSGIWPIPKGKTGDTKRPYWEKSCIPAVSSSSGMHITFMHSFGNL